MEPTTETSKLRYKQVNENDSTNESAELSTKLKDIVPSGRKMEKAKEIISKLDPEQFKAVTGRDLFKK